MNQEITNVLRMPVRSWKSDGATYRDCPRCGGRSKLEISHDESVFHCHKCGYSGGTGRKNKTAPGRSGPDFSLFSILPERDARVRWLKDSRRMTEGQIERLQPHGGPDSMRVYFPLTDAKGELSGFQGRMTIPDVKPKYKTTAGSDYFWGWNNLEQYPKRLVLCEGIFDAVHGTNRIAMIGTQLRLVHLKLLGSLTSVREVIVFLDGDARIKAWKLAKTLWAAFRSLNIGIAYPPGDTDPDDWKMNSEQFLETVEWL